MKTMIYGLVILIIGALTFKPMIPRHYPPKKVLEQKQSNVFREIKLESLIRKADHEVRVDSIQLEMIKQQ